jgi:CheY-like chemotaxis protein
MKILVIDDEHSFGALLGHTLKRLGHKPVVAVDPSDALEMLTPDVDAVITDIDMPGMNGVELARAIRELDKEMPIAFCTGSCPEGRTIDQAARLGKVLPKVWTVADVKAVVDGLTAERASHRQPRERAPSPVAHLYADLEPEPKPAARAMKKVRISFRNWQQVQRLCRDGGEGPVYVTVPGPEDLDPGSAVTIALVLPEEITVKIAGEVQAVRPCGGGGKPEVVIQLSGLNEALITRLHTLAAASATPLPKPRLSAYLQVSARAERQRQNRGTPDALARGSQNRLKVSQMLRSNQELRHQIEGLPARMMPRPGDAPDDVDTE